MLLSSSQVSFIISTLTILLFTIALFLAGYILQQQTVRSLSEDIRPRMQARMQPLSNVLGLTLQPQFATATVRVPGTTYTAEIGSPSIKSQVGVEVGGEAGLGEARRMVDGGLRRAEEERQKTLEDIGREE